MLWIRKRGESRESGIGNRESGIGNSRLQQFLGVDQLKYEARSFGFAKAP
ncbi:hypothetical protein [Moorena sp. SIO3H5]|nr:hypothetical protein [Moorena sp. SIO3H5]NEO70150.1 hypothetical protein [Moorena sp. SIO3H5]